MVNVINNELEQEEAQKEAVDKIDFKMVTFSLAGKDYGIDIMKVKEIAKDYDFTYVPNTAPYVRGVYNLRGDIISIIDLRIMFNLPITKKKDGENENMIILRLDDKILGIIVDSTDKVVGISSKNIQPTHPLFGDINVKYISGVVENDQKLYIILDVERIFGSEAVPHVEESREELLTRTRPAIEEGAPAAIAAVEDTRDLQLQFIRETLATFVKFHVTPLNEEWVKTRLSEWEEYRGSENRDIQLTSAEEAEEFLSPFYSPYTGTLFGDDYLTELKNLLPVRTSTNVSIWNPGCGKGYESYSLACFLKNFFPDARIKIWANDNDLLSISSAPGIQFTKSEVPESMQKYLSEGKNGYYFSSEIKDSILFDYHDVLNQNQFPPVDIIVARDILSFLQPFQQERMLGEFKEKLKPNGILLLGQNERAFVQGYVPFETGSIVAYRKETG